MTTEIASYTHPIEPTEGLTVNPAPGNYYVGCRDGARSSLLLGPFEWHQEAIDRVSEVRQLVEQHNPWAHFWGFGTSGITSKSDSSTAPLPAGKLNQHFPEAPIRDTVTKVEATDE